MKSFSIEVRIEESLPQEKRDLLRIQLLKKFIEIAGDDFNGTCLIFSSPSPSQSEDLNIEEREKDLIRKALEKHRGKRQLAADELGISQRVLYRKIKEYDLR
jgi:transcriptional regulator with PAS, ATPase and Fis domain